jgi:transcription elongation GreA/GreB family factor
MDKAGLLLAAIAQVEAKLQELRAGYQAAREATLATPHVMKSKREVFGQESAYLANALALNIQEREYEVRALRSLRLPERPARVALGCLVGVGPPEGPPDRLYFLLPVCGGMEVSLDRCTVRVVTPGTPVARALLGKSLGDEVRLPPDAAQPACVQLLV